MYYRVPISYADLISHPYDFIQAPDPINDRAVFDKWFTEDLMGVIGSRTDRQVNLQVSALGNAYESVNAWPDHPTKIQGKLGFFWFIYRGVVVPVIVINVSRFDPAFVDLTLCVGLFNGSQIPWDGTVSLERLSNGGLITQIDIYKTSKPMGVFLGDFGASFVDSTGDTWTNLPDNVAFGLGFLGVTETK